MRVLGMVVLLVASVSAASAWAQPSAGPPAGQGAPTGNSDNRGGVVGGQPTAAVVIAKCDQASSPPVKAAAPISVRVNLATQWQPRGGEVLVEVKADPDLLKSFAVRACFGWGNGMAGDYFMPDNLSKTFSQTAFIEVRPSQTIGLINIGIGVPPELDPAPSNLLSRLGNHIRSSGLGLVPIADMRLIGYNDTGVLFDVVRPIGITSVWVSGFFALALTAGATALLYRFATAGTPARPPGASRLGALSVIRLDWVLRLVQGDDGRASLSAFQVLLWTIVVASSSVYVMALSGQLINVTPGTLTLLGIAGAAGLLTAIQGSPAPFKGAAPVLSWTHLVQKPDSGHPDVARVQMLLFTVVSAGFVLLQVINNYIIPDIPEGYLILMGISNGVYVGARLTR